MNKKHCFKINKLVRDHTTEIIRSHGIIVYERVMEKDEYIERLKDKLLEEANEVIASKTSDENLEELADLLEVIHALGKESGLSIEQIEEKRISKKQERGGFENRIYNTYIEVNPKSIVTTCHTNDLTLGSIGLIFIIRKVITFMYLQVSVKDHQLQ